MSFHNDIISHLVKYKGETLHVEKDGIFTYRGKGIPKAHILPTNYRNLNILPEYRNQFFKSEYANIKFHRYFHHLNSSQAMCINLFYPLVNEEKLDLILDFLKLNCLEQPVPHFEKESELEQASRRTNFDFYLKCSSAINRRTEIFFEIKYTENGFGKAKPDEKHKKKFNETYLPLVKNSVFLTDSCKEESIFLDHYQLLRNFVHATLSSYVVILFPSANTAVKQQINWAFHELLTVAGQEKVKAVFLEEFLSFLEDQLAGSLLGEYYRGFRNKYVPQE